MLLFGHIGITLGASTLLAKALPSSRFSTTTRNEAIESPSYSSQAATTLSNPPSHKGSGLASLGSCIDIRLLLIGSLLPDIIDKPIGLLFFRETFSNGRIFCHTLLFLILITLAGLYLYKSHERTSLLAISFGTFTHLIFDQMWCSPKTLFWPIYGFTFDRVDVSDWIPNILHGMMTDPQVYVPELVGTAILLWFTLELVQKRQVFYFLKCGHVQ